MIRVSKNTNAPQSLSATRQYDGEDVKAELLADHRNKCYLCERTRYTDFAIEHYKSETNNPELIQDWNNLFLACSYCNGKKLHNFDDILNPLSVNIEDVIEQKVDFVNMQAIFNCKVEETLSHTKTIELLQRIFNGTNSLRKIKENNFFNYLLSKINIFQQLVNNYLLNPTVQTEEEVRKELDIDREFLGFKYWIIKNNNRLYSVFSNDIIWNKV